MDLDSLTDDQLYFLVDGFFFFLPQEETRSYLESTLLELMDYHGTSEGQLMQALSDWEGGTLTTLKTPYDSEARWLHFDAL